LKEFAKYQIDIIDPTKKVNHTLREGTKKIQERTGEVPTREEETQENIEGDEVGEGHEDDEDDEDEVVNLDYKKIAETLSIYIPMMAIFSNEIPCSNLKECIRTIITNVEGFETFCLGYQDEQHDTLGCYMNLIMGYSKKDFLNSLKFLLKFLESSGTSQLINMLIIIYDTIGGSNG